MMLTNVVYASVALTVTVLLSSASGQIYEKKPVLPEEKHSVPRTDIKKVHIISMNHLDVGFNHFLDDVLNLYFTQYFPRAVSLAQQLRTEGYPETFIYTTHPWLVSLYVNCPQNIHIIGSKVKCPSAKNLTSFRAAVRRGDISWHAGPMNMQFEVMDQSLADFALELSQSLDRDFGIQRRYRTMSQRDVPGLTHAVIPLLASRGVVGLSVGVNAASAPPSVPRIFNWWYGNQSVIAMWHPGGYPDNPGPYPSNPGGLSVDDCLTVPGLDEALCFAFRSDNQGPPESVQEILGQYEILRVEFPNAQLTASTLEQFTQAVYPLKSRLPNITAEIGDTWIQGIQSDPMKVKELKTFLRLRAQCINQGDCSMSDRSFYNSSRLLLKSAEHTWGRNGVGDSQNWRNMAFEKVRYGQTFTDSVKSWLAQREFTYMAVRALGDSSLAQRVMDEWISGMAWKPDLRGYSETGARLFDCGGLTVGFTQDGFLRDFLDKTSQVKFTGHFGRLEYRTYNQSDFDDMDRQYTYKTWFRLGVEKPNITDNAHPDSRWWTTKLLGFYMNDDISDSCDFYAHLSMSESEAHYYYGSPDEYYIRYTSKPGQSGATQELDVEVQYFNKQPTRLPEALFYSFRPDPSGAASGEKWYYQKLGRLIDPENVVVNGSWRQHAVDDHIYLYDPSQRSALDITSYDVALVSTLTASRDPTVFPLPLNPSAAGASKTKGKSDFIDIIHSTRRSKNVEQFRRRKFGAENDSDRTKFAANIEPITGSSFNFFNNIWNTNYVFWYPFLEDRQDGNFKARFSLKVVDAQEFEKIPRAENRVGRDTTGGKFKFEEDTTLRFTGRNVG